MSIGTVKKNYPNLNIFWRGSGKLIILIVLISALIFPFTKIKSSEYFPIRNVKIFGAKDLDHREVETLVAPLVRNGFFGVDIERIKDLALQLPWVSQVVVRRVWPDAVVIAITEKTPVAVWNDNSLLSAAGEVFTPATKTYPAVLPKFSGPSGEQLLMAQYYAKMNDLLKPLHFNITKLELTPAMTWCLTLNNGIKLNVGHKDILTRLDHFVKVYSKIVGDRVADVDYIDLRYPNGVAVRWKSVT